MFKYVGMRWHEKHRCVIGVRCVSIQVRHRPTSIGKMNQTDTFAKFCQGKPKMRYHFGIGLGRSLCSLAASLCGHLPHGYINVPADNNWLATRCPRQVSKVLAERVSPCILLRYSWMAHIESGPCSQRRSRSR